MEDTFEDKKQTLLEDIDELRTRAEELYSYFEDSEPYYETTEGEEHMPISDPAEAARQKRRSLDKFVDTCDELSGIVREFRQPGPHGENEGDRSEPQVKEHNYQFGARAASSVSMLSAEMSYLDFRKQRTQRLPQQSPPRLTTKATKISNYVQTQIFPALRRVSTTLHNLLLSMVKPKSWSIEGVVGTKLFVFQGNVSLSIDFGK